MNLFGKFFKPKKPMRLVDAILSGNIRQVRKLLKQGADANARIQGERGCPLHFASHSYVNIMKLLIDNGADVNVKDKSGQTPLHIAAYVGYVEGVRLLLENGADINAGDNEGKTPLYYATKEPSIYDHIFSPWMSWRPSPESPPGAAALKEKEDREKVARLLIAYGAKSGHEERAVPTPEEVMRRTGMSEEELTRQFLLHLIQKGKNPFADMPEKYLKEALEKYPDIIDLARKKFGKIK